MNDLQKRFPIYTRLLRLYPQTYINQYGAELLQTTADMLDDANSIPNRAAIWLRIGINFPLNLSKQQFQYVGGVMFNETPHYIKRNSILASILLVPFVLALLANGLDKVVHDSTLQQSWVWNASIITLWAVWLPLTAFVLALLSYVRLVASKPDKEHASWWKRVLHIQRSWPILVPLVLSLGTLLLLTFHDVGQCWLQTPQYLAGHMHQAWRCSVTNFSYPHRLI